MQQRKNMDRRFIQLRQEFYQLQTSVRFSTSNRPGDIFTYHLKCYDILGQLQEMFQHEKVLYLFQFIQSIFSLMFSMLRQLRPKEQKFKSTKQSTDYGAQVQIVTYNKQDQVFKKQQNKMHQKIKKRNCMQINLQNKQISQMNSLERRRLLKAMRDSIQEQDNYGQGYPLSFFKPKTNDYRFSGVDQTIKTAIDKFKESDISTHIFLKHYAQQLSDAEINDIKNYSQLLNKQNISKIVKFTSSYKQKKLCEKRKLKIKSQTVKQTIHPQPQHNKLRHSMSSLNSLGEVYEYPQRKKISSNKKMRFPSVLSRLIDQQISQNQLQLNNMLKAEDFKRSSQEYLKHKPDKYNSPNKSLNLCHIFRTEKNNQHIESRFYGEDISKIKKIKLFQANFNCKFLGLNQKQHSQKDQFKQKIAKCKNASTIKEFLYLIMNFSIIHWKFYIMIRSNKIFKLLYDMVVIRYSKRFIYINYIIRISMQGMEKINDEFYVDRTKELGKGNFGVVYKGFYASQNKIIAVKFMDSVMLKKNPDYERQIDVMKDLAKVSHPNIMGYLGFQKTKSGIFVFLQFCGGGSLKQLAKKKISQMKVMTLFKQFLEAMTYINKLNKVHRDLKPDNLMLDQNLQLKIADFGLARDISVIMTKGACTPLYAAPQVIKLELYDQRCDVWSAGMILYEMITGKQMFAHIKAKQQLLAELQSFKSNQKKIGYSKQIHPQWQIITMKMLTHNYNKRPTFQEMLKYFESVRQGMQKDLVQKYGFDKTQDDALRRTKKISPYQSDPNNKVKGLDMLAKLKEQQSFNKLNNVRKYLNFFRMKTDFMNKLIKQFTTNQYATLKNVYKYALMFLSVSTYMSRLKENLVQIKARKLKTPDGVVTDQQLIKAHQGQWISLLRDFNQKHEANLVRFQKVLDAQIIVKITGSYMKRQQQKKILTSYKNLLPWIEEAQKGNYLASNEYMKMFVQIMNNKQVYSSDNELKQMSHSDVKTYTYMRCVGNMDKIFPQKQYQNQDCIRIIRQQVQNMSKQDLVNFVSKINSK